jgi:hypothetical protein
MLLTRNVIYCCSVRLSFEVLLWMKGILFLLIFCQFTYVVFINNRLSFCCYCYKLFLFILLLWSLFVLNFFICWSYNKTFVFSWLFWSFFFDYNLFINNIFFLCLFGCFFLSRFKYIRYWILMRISFYLLNFFNYFNFLCGLDYVVIILLNLFDWLLCLNFIYLFNISFYFVFNLFCFLFQFILLLHNSLILYFILLLIALNYLFGGFIFYNNYFFLYIIIIILFRLLNLLGKNLVNLLFQNLRRRLVVFFIIFRSNFLLSQIIRLSFVFIWSHWLLLFDDNNFCILNLRWSFIHSFFFFPRFFIFYCFILLRFLFYFFNIFRWTNFTNILLLFVNMLLARVDEVSSWNSKDKNKL